MGAQQQQQQQQQRPRTPTSRQIPVVYEGEGPYVRSQHPQDPQCAHAILVMEIMDTRDLSMLSPSQRIQIEASGCEDHNCQRILSTDSGDRRSSTIPSLVGEPRTFSQFKL